MDKTVIGLVAAIGAFTAMAPAQAEVSAALNDAMQASTFGDLLRPIPNAAALLKIADEQQPVSSDRGVQLAQDYHHHHHHHHRRRYHHHHHHHYY